MVLLKPASSSCSNRPPSQVTCSRVLSREKLKAPPLPLSRHKGLKVEGWAYIFGPPPPETALRQQKCCPMYCTSLINLFMWSFAAHFVNICVAYYGTQKGDTHTHMFIVWELISELHRRSVTQGCLAGIISCNSGTSTRCLSVNANYTQKLRFCWPGREPILDRRPKIGSLPGQRNRNTRILLEFIFQLHAHLLHQKIVSELFV